MGYFSLFPIAKFESDKSGATIINLLDFSRINYNKEQKDILLSVLNKDIGKIQELDEEKRCIVNELLDKGLAYLYTNNIRNGEHKENRDIEIRGLVEEVPHFSKLYFEITNECDRNCGFCNNRNLVEGACESCIKWKRGEEIDVQRFDYEAIIERIGDLWVDQVIISGGNPFINKNLLIDYIDKIRKYMPDVEIVVYTNGGAIDDKVLEILYSNNVVLNFIILEEDYSKDAHSDVIFLNEKLNYIIEKCIDEDIACCFSLFGVKNEDSKVIKINCETTVKVKKNISYKQEIFEHNKFINRKEIKNPNYFLNQKYNSCLHNKLAITMDGFIRPCPMIEEKLLDLKSEKFDTLFQKMLIDKYWRFTKKNVQMCMECPYKFSCEDCTAIELEINSRNVMPDRMCDRYM